MPLGVFTCVCGSKLWCPSFRLIFWRSIILCFVFASVVDVAVVDISDVGWLTLRHSLLPSIPLL